MKFVTLIGIFFCIQCFGQVSSKAGRFSADYSTGCVPFTISLSEHDGFGGIERVYFYENEDDVTSSLSHTYDRAGTYNLVQLVGIDRDPITGELIDKTDTLQIEVIEPAVPTYTYEFCGDRRVLVTIDDTYYDDYEVTFAGSSVKTASNGESVFYAFNTTEVLSIDVKGVFDNAANNCAVSSHCFTKCG